MIRQKLLKILRNEKIILETWLSDVKAKIKYLEGKNGNK